MAHEDYTSAPEWAASRPDIADSDSYRIVLVPALGIATIGFLLVYLAGFAEVPALHDAAHDARHVQLFPCH